MAYSVTLDAANRITGLYTDADGYASPPPESVGVTAEQGEQLRHGFAAWTLAGGELVAFVPPPVSLQTAQSLKVIEIEAARDAACYMDVTAHAKQWQADRRSQELLGQSITLAQAGLPLPSVWRAADNSDMAIASLADLLTIAGAMALQTQAAYERSWLRKTEVADATTVQQVELIVW